MSDDVSWYKRLLGFSDRYLEETAQYLAAYCPDKAVIEKYLTLIEKIAARRRQGSSKIKILLLRDSFCFAC